MQFCSLPSIGFHIYKDGIDAEYMPVHGKKSGSETFWTIIYQYGDMYIPFIMLLKVIPSHLPYNYMHHAYYTGCSENTYFKPACTTHVLWCVR